MARVVNVEQPFHQGGEAPFSRTAEGDLWRVHFDALRYWFVHSLLLSSLPAHLPPPRTGVIDLALSCAHEWDPSDRAVSYWLDETPPNDSRSSAYEQRKACNALVFEALAHMDKLLDEAAAAAQKGGGSCAFSSLPLVSSQILM
jgi:hypothetical protein